MIVLDTDRSRYPGHVRFADCDRAVLVAGEVGRDVYSLEWVDLGTGRRTAFPHRVPAGLFALTPDGMTVGYADRVAVATWDARAAAPGPRFELGPLAPQHHVAFSPDGRWLVFDAGRIGGLITWDHASGQNPTRLTAANADRQPAEMPYFTPDDRVVAVEGRAGRRETVVHRWRLADGTRLPPVTPGRAAFFLGYTGDGRWMVFHAGRKVTFVDTRNAAQRSEILGRRLWEWLVLSPDGATAVLVPYADEGGTAEVWDVHPPRRRFTVKPFDWLDGCVAFAPDGRRLLVALRAEVRLLDAATGAERARYDWRVGPVAAVAFAAGGGMCAAVGRRGKLVVWDVD